MSDTKNLYDKHANLWNRENETSLSDFTARRFLFDWCGELTGKDVIDLGCGEGYCSREIKKRGANRVVGVELSPNMVQLARQRENAEAAKIEFVEGDVANLQFSDSSFDLVLAVFVYNYLNLADTAKSFSEAYRVLRPGGRFIFAVPHPSFAFLGPPTPPFFFEVDSSGYFSGRDQCFAGEIHRVDGTALPVQMIHKTIEDYFFLLKESGFQSLPAIKELRVTPELLSEIPNFFAPLVDRPLHIAFRLEKHAC